MPAQPPLLTGEVLHSLVVRATAGADAETRVLLQATLPLLVECVAAVLLDQEDGQDVSERLGMRDEVLKETACRIIEREFLEEWRRLPAKEAWGFLESRVQRLAAAIRDRAWVQRALHGRHSAAQALLFVRLRGLFAGAARRRRLSLDEQQDAFQSFAVWLLADGGRNLLRWDPDGGRSFDGWFSARALNQIDSRRRDARADFAEEFADDIGHSEEPRLSAYAHIGELNDWLKQNCNERQYDIFIRTFVEQQSAAEVAAAMGVRPGVVWTTVLRLRKALVSFQAT
jgi:RNA polymerase sigma factor (sigma-70 family)